MDDHPPSWGGNGAAALRDYGLTDNAVCRLNPFLLNSTRDPPPPIDAVTFAKGLVENYSLTHVELYRCGIDGDGMTALAQAISVNKYVVYLGLARNAFFTVGGIMLCEALKVNQTLQTVDLSWNELRNEFAVALAEMLHMNMSLQRVLLDKNKIADDGISALSAVLATTRKLRFLSLSHNKIGAAGLSMLAEAMRTNLSLQTLDVSQNGALSEGAFSLFDALKAPNATLQTLNVAYNRVGPTIVVLGAALSAGCTALRELNLENCHLAAGAEFSAFAAAIRGHECLCSISLACNEHLGDAGAADACAALAHIAPLRFVDLSDCGLTSASLESVGLLLGSTARVATLHLSGNDYSGAEGGAALGRLLLAATQLDFIGLSRCRLGSSGVEQLSRTLRLGKASFSHLALRSNAIGDAGFGHLLPFCLAHRRLEFLDLAHNDLTGFVRSRFLDVFRANPKLPYIALGDKTLIDADSCYRDWAEVDGHTGPTASTPPPKHCDASLDIATTFAPSAGFAVYSLAVGSAMKRQLEGAAFATEGMLPHAGKPCRGATVWKEPQRIAVSRYQQKHPGTFSAESSASAVAAYEANIGGLLVSDDQMRREFNRLDRGGNGYLNFEDFKRVYRSFESFGLEYTEQHLDRIIKEHCADGRKVTYEAFCVLMLKLVNR